MHKLPILQDHVLKMPFERPLLDIHAYTFECMAFPLDIIQASEKNLARKFKYFRTFLNSSNPTFLENLGSKIHNIQILK